VRRARQVTAHDEQVEHEEAGQHPGEATRDHWFEV
jgi:hypothetical protein